MPNTVHLHRVLATSPEKIYRAFLEADALAKWLPPNGFACTVHHLEPKAGGTFKMCEERAIDCLQTGCQNAVEAYGVRYMRLSLKIAGDRRFALSSPWPARNGAGAGCARRRRRCKGRWSADVPRTSGGLPGRSKASGSPRVRAQGTAGTAARSCCPHARSCLSGPR